MKKRISRRQFLAALGVTAAAGVLAGCGGSDSSSASAASSGAASVPAGEIVYPTYPLADGTKTISVYMRDSTSGVVSNWGDIKCFQVAADKLGVNIQFIHPAVGSEADQFNLMIASGEYPDVIQWDFRSSAMSLEQLIDSGVLINMNDLIHTYAPNYLDLMESNESYRKEGVTNDGEYAAFYGYSGRAPLSGGPTIRADLLKEYGLEVPVTVDDWTNVLTAMKEHGHQYPMTTGKDRSGHVWFTVLFPAYQTSNSYCLDPASGEIVYGPITDNFRTYLAKMHEWYQDGLIDLGNRVYFSSGGIDTDILLMPSGFELDLLDRGGYLVNLGYSSEGRTTAEITFARTGVYRLSGIRMYAQPMESFDSLVGALQARGIQDAVVEDGFVSGSISLAEPAVMVFSIPYSEGWTAKVDGAPVETLASAGSLLAVSLEAGSHEIELHYETPWLRAGCAISAVSACLLVAALIVGRRKHKGVQP